MGVNGFEVSWFGGPNFGGPVSGNGSKFWWGSKIGLTGCGFWGPELWFLSAGVVVHHASAWQLWLIGCPGQTSVGELQNLVYRPAHFGRNHLGIP